MSQQQNQQYYNYLVQEKANLDKFRNQLSQAYTHIKSKSDLIDALEKQGIKDLDGLNSFVSSQQAQNPQDDSTTQTAPQIDAKDNAPEGFVSQEKFNKLEEAHYKLQHSQDRILLKEQLKNEINKKDHPLLSRHLSDDVLDNIIHNRNLYQNEFKQELPLKEAVKTVEDNLQRAMKPYGLEVNKEPVQIDDGIKVGVKQPEPQKDFFNQPQTINQFNQTFERGKNQQMNPSQSQGAYQQIQPPNHPNFKNTTKVGSSAISDDAEFEKFMASQGVEE